LNNFLGKSKDCPQIPNLIHLLRFILTNLEKFLTKIQKRRSVVSQEYHVPIKIQQTQEEAPKETTNSLQPEDTKKINSIFMFHDEEKKLKVVGNWALTVEIPGLRILVVGKRTNRQFQTLPRPRQQ
jgi:hypothetical protein